MVESIGKITAKLKEIIDRNGLVYLTEEPYKVYQELLQSEKTDRKAAGLILYALVNDVQNEIEPGGDTISLSKLIQRKCSLNKKTADYLSAIFLNLYSKENKNSWKERNLEGLSQFFAEEFVCTWKGVAVWDEGNGTVDCYYQAELILSPCEDAISEGNLSLLLKKNPFMTREAIHQYFERDLREYLDGEFEEYCTCDDYYQPVVEDFDIDYYVSEWCEKHGFKMISCDGTGEDGGYEPKFRKGWY
ncbi:MAG: hypothetical protein LUC99_00855 [Clostridiales bacterium]|nr:hypothetical protein [Clostridiales bacterium]